MTSELAALQQTNWDGVVVIRAGTPFERAWMSEKHLALHLSQRFPILYVDPPVSVVASRKSTELADGRLRPFLRLSRPNMAHLTPVVYPYAHRTGVRIATEQLTQLLTRRAIKRLGGQPRATIVATAEAQFGPLSGRRVVYATDDWTAGAGYMGQSLAALTRMQRRQARDAEQVVAISPALVDKWRALGHQPLLIPNGCEYEAFARDSDRFVPGDVRLPGPIAGFVGYLSDRIDLRLLEAVAAQGVSLLLIGPRSPTFEISRMESLLARPNVQWVGPKPFEQLPSYLRMFSVGLTPYARSVFNEASFPLKTLEYLAAGLPAVVTGLPVNTWLGTDLITIADNPNDYASAVVHAVAQPRSEELIRRRREVARGHTWSARSDEFARLLEPASRPERVVARTEGVPA